MFLSNVQCTLLEAPTAFWESHISFCNEMAFHNNSYAAILISILTTTKAAAAV